MADPMSERERAAAERHVADIHATYSDLRNASTNLRRIVRLYEEVERLRAAIETFKAPDDFHNAAHRARRLDALTETIAEMTLAGRPPKVIAKAAMQAADAAIWAVEREHARMTELAEIVNAGAEACQERTGQAEAERDSLAEDLARAEAEHAAAMERLFRDLAMRRREHYATTRRAEQAEAVLRELDVTDDEIHQILQRIAARRRGAEQSRIQQARIQTTRRDGSTP